MHGRPRKTPKPEDAEASAAKASKLRSLQSHLLQVHHNSDYGKEALDVSAKIVEINPEWHTAWNYRKVALEQKLRQSGSDPQSVIDDELRVVESALRQNFKSYGGWQHRKWVLNKGHPSIDRELRLLDQFLKSDSRNFHAWNYRRFVAALQNILDEAELQFTTNMININFSNYSAWHNRSVLLSRLLNKGVDGFSPKEKVLAEEYDLVHQALFTDPDDQSGWFYHLWLFDQTVKPEAPLLVSSWPSHGSDLIVPTNRCLDGCALSPFASFYSYAGTFPIILYFDRAVEGVNSSTVNFGSTFVKNNDVLWQPLSTLCSSAAQAWVAHINLPDQFSKAFQVEVSVGHCHGICSVSGSPYSSSHFVFTVCVQPADAKHSDYKKHCQEPGIVFPFDQLKINEDHVSVAFKWRAEAIANEIALFRELSSEFDCKFAKLSLARLLLANDEVVLFINGKKGHLEEVVKLFNELMVLDPLREHFYKDQRSLVLLQQVTCTKESLLKHCSPCAESTSSLISSSACLRLNNLSLTRIGSVERLLWVQMLDLSHNELQSIEGLEAMQLLKCLNLSHNKICSFMALGPLRLVKCLRVLDVSCNEIGLHGVDTARYLCSSPLTHASGIDGVEMGSHWEALFVFKGLNLTRLDAEGNAAMDESLRSSLRKLLPGLEWLDGEKLH